MKKILEIFKGDKGEFSSKRFVGIIGAFVLFGTMAHNSMSPQDIAPSKELVEKKVEEKAELKEAVIEADTRPKSWS